MPTTSLRRKLRTPMPLKSCGGAPKTIETAFDGDFPPA
jgi:hypothetical protein